MTNETYELSKIMSLMCRQNLSPSFVTRLGVLPPVKGGVSRPLPYKKCCAVVAAHLARLWAAAGRRLPASPSTGRWPLTAVAGRLPVGRSGDEIDRLAENLNAMLERIEALMAGLKEVSDLGPDGWGPMDGRKP